MEAVKKWSESPFRGLRNEQCMLAFNFPLVLVTFFLNFFKINLLMYNSNTIVSPFGNVRLNYFYQI